MYYLSEYQNIEKYRNLFSNPPYMNEFTQGKCESLIICALRAIRILFIPQNRINCRFCSFFIISYRMPYATL